MLATIWQKIADSLNALMPEFTYFQERLSSLRISNRNRMASACYSTGVPPTSISNFISSVFADKS